MKPVLTKVALKESVIVSAILLNKEGNLILNTPEYVTSPGFYFIMENDNAISVNHVGNQKQQVGFKEVMHRLNYPRSLQNTNLCTLITGAIHAKKNITVRYMNYPQMLAFFAQEEYGNKNNGQQLIGMLRDTYHFYGRKDS